MRPASLESISGVARMPREVVHPCFKTWLTSFTDGITHMHHKYKNEVVYISEAKMTLAD